MSAFSIEGTKGGIPALDGLRAIAVVLVLLRHAAYPVAANMDGPVWEAGGHDFATFLINGWVGVDLFFVLSGFLIGGQLLRNEARGRAFEARTYFAKRFLRIMPTYVFVLVIVLAGVIPLYQVSTEDLSWRVIYHLFVMQDYFPSDIVVAFWSLGVEEKFYLAAPILLGCAFWKGSDKARFIVIGGMVLAAVISRAVTAGVAEGVDDYTSFFPVFRSPFHHCIDALGLGMLAALIYQRLERGVGSFSARHAHVMFWGAALALIALLCSHDLMASIGVWDKVLQSTMIACLFTLLLFSAARGGGPQKLLGARVMVLTARLSYPLYLIHLPLIPLAWALSGALPTGGGAALAQFLPVYFVVVFAGAYFIHLVVEKPFLRIKDRVGKPARALKAVPAE